MNENWQEVIKSLVNEVEQGLNKFPGYKKSVDFLSNSISMVNNAVMLVPMGKEVTGLMLLHDNLNVLRAIESEGQQGYEQIIKVKKALAEVNALVF